MVKAVLSLLVVAVLAQPVAARSMTVLAPSSQWQVDYAEESCALQRMFGQEGEQVALEIRDFGRGSGRQQIIVASKDFTVSSSPISWALTPLGKPVDEKVVYQVTLGSGAAGRLFAIERNFDQPDTTEAFRAYVVSANNLTDTHREYLLNSIDSAGDTKKAGATALSPIEQDEVYKMAWNGFSLTPDYQSLTAQALAAVDAVQFSGLFTQDIALRTGSLVAAFKALENCQDELVAHWGVDPEAYKTLSRFAILDNSPTMTRYIKGRYPTSAYGMQREGVARVRLNISAEGEVTACHPLAAGTHEDFYRQVCDAFKNYGRFSPALNAQGMPFPSVYFQNVFYYLS